MARVTTDSARRGAAAAVVLLLGLVPASGAIAGDGLPSSPPQAQVRPSDALKALLEANDDQGAPILGEQERETFSSLPGSAKELFNAAVEEENITSTEHLGELLRTEMAPDQLDVVLRDNCFMCHSDAESQTPENLFSLDPAAQDSPPFMSLSALVNDVHLQKGLSCAGCHGGDPSDVMDHDFPETWPEDADERSGHRQWVPVFCGRCHADVDLVGQFNSNLPTDQLAKYRQGAHGHALLEGDGNGSAECVSCHGVHGILGKNDPRSPVYAKNVPETCASCHADSEKMKGVTLADGSPLPVDQLERYRTSVHGVALLERGDTGSPACNDCHGGHATRIPPQRVCEECHAGEGQLFAGSKHKQAFEEHGWKQCSQCHGYHAVEKTSDELLTVEEGSLCRDCHDEYARDNPACVATADFFHGSLEWLVQGKERVERLVEPFARKGLDVEPLEDGLGRLDELLRQLRSRVHTFDPDRFAEVSGPAEKVLTELEGAVTQARGEYSRRRRGLYVAMAIIALLMLLLWVKLKSLE